MAEQKQIRYGDRTMTMPPGMTLEQAKEIMARHFPELAENPRVETKRDGETTTYVFSKQAGRKGSVRRARPVARSARNLSRLEPVPVVPPSLVKLAMGKGGGTYAIHQDESQVEAQVRKVRAVAAALLELKPALDAAEGVLLL